MGLAFVLGTLLCTVPARAANHALLIGVADYPNLPRRLWLRAPGNDVALMHEVLQQRGFEPAKIRQLVSRAGGALEPTRQNILEAMRSVHAEVQPGDQVVLYLAGHGSQQPQPADHGTRPTEADGLDEVFLPADVQRWTGETSAAAIPNALLDDEIGEWIDALADRGAVVWGIFDTCHAAGMARGQGGRTRAVAPADLGLPAPRPLQRPQASMPSPGRTDHRILAFAARTQESTTEEWLPQGARLGSNRLHGVFTFHVAHALKDLPQPTLQDIERALRAAYASEKRTAPTPQFRGDASARLR